MLIDAHSIVSGCVFDCEVCVVGCGAAGVTAARELVRRGVEVLLLEAGGKSRSGMQVDAYRGEVSNSNHGALHLYRQRRLGGTLTVWGGRAAPYEAIDLEHRVFLPGSGWPLTINELEPYYRIAQEYLDLGPYEYKAEGSLHPKDQLPAGSSPGSVLTLDKLFRFSLPTNLWEKYKSELVHHGKMRVIANGSCTEIILNEAGTRVDWLRVESPANRSFRVRAKYVVLAMGGLEVTRLLLASRGIQKSGIGNERDLLGRYYMSHVTGTAGKVRFCQEYAHCFSCYPRDRTGVYCQRTIALTPEVQRREQLQNLAVTARPPDFHNPEHGNAVLSSVYLAKRYFLGKIPPEFSREMSDAQYHQLTAHLRNVMCGPISLIGFGALWARKRIFARRKLPSVSIKDARNIYTVHFDAEQSPHRDNRVTLLNECDQLKMPRIRVNWNLRRQDIESAARSLRLIGKSLADASIAQVDLRARLEDVIVAEGGAGSHHMGTTRMGRAPDEGVVDRNCTVFGVDNLHVASSSTFPTSSYVNPTFQIVAMSARIASIVTAKLNASNSGHDGFATVPRK